jgi:hypothetical protein
MEKNNEISELWGKFVCFKICMFKIWRFLELRKNLEVFEFTGEIRGF